MIIDAKGMDYRELNELIRSAKEDVLVKNCLGQRFIGDGICDIMIEIDGVPGNGLGAYLSGAEIVVRGNAQDATGDTMDKGRIVVHGDCGDAAGYAMRGGEIFIKGSVGYRAGIHMKAYEGKSPLMVIGGAAGSFLGEYQAGGTIVVLGLGVDPKRILGYFCGTGMHGGRIFVRADEITAKLPEQVAATEATAEELDSIRGGLAEYSKLFGVPESELYSKRFFVLTPNTKSPYKQLYVPN